jgi:predicted acyl esterase
MRDRRLSQPVYPRSVLEEIRIVADDGVAIAARVLRPVVPKRTKIPAILHLSPYLRAEIPARQIHPELQALKYVQRGYALVGVSLRGTGASGGCLDYQGARDRADVDAIVDAIARQPWSNGKVGGIGLSWAGTALNAAALSGNPHLKTVVPVASNTDWYLWSFMQGVPAWYQGYVFNTYTAPVLAAFGGVSTPPQRIPDRMCPDVGSSIVSQTRTALNGLRDEWWDERDLTRHVSNLRSDIAVLQVSGARDDGVRPDNLPAWDRIMRQRLPNYRLLLGDWTHVWPDTPNILGLANPELEGNRYPLKSWRVLLLRWFDRWLKGVRNGIDEMPRALLQDNLGNWHGEDALDPSRAKVVKLHPRADGTLRRAPGPGTASYFDDGLGVDPRGTCAYVAAGVLLGCVNVKHPNAVFFVGDAERAERRFSGVIRAHLHLAHSMPRGTVGVTVYDVSTAAVWTPLTYGIASLDVSEDERSRRSITPGVPFTRTIEVMARDFVLPPGHQLAVAVGTQVGRYPRGLMANGYAPVPSGGQTTLHLGPRTFIELNELTGPTPILDLR